MKTTAFLLAVLAFCPVMAAVDGDDPDVSIDRAPAVEGLNSDEDRLVPYVDGNGALNGYIRETFPVPADSPPAPHQAENETPVEN